MNKNEGPNATEEKKESSKGGFKLLKYTAQPDTVIPLTNGPIGPCPIPRSPPTSGGQAVVQGCVANVRQGKGGIVVDLKSTACNDIVKDVPNMTPGNRGFWMKHLRVNGQPLEDPSKKTKKKKD